MTTTAYRTLPLVLASGSPRRQELLRVVRVPFRVLASGYVEDNSNAKSPSALVMQHARRKAADVAQKVPHGVVVGADTLVYCGRKMYGKPADMPEARRMLRELQGRSHFVYTGLAVCDVDQRQWVVDFARTRVTMRPLTDGEIARYFELIDPLDKAGAYAIQEAGALIIERIDGCYYNVIGFPMAKLDDMLRRLGYTLFKGK